MEHIAGTVHELHPTPPPTGCTPCDMVAALEDLGHSIESAHDKSATCRELDNDKLTEALEGLTFWIRQLGNGDAGTSMGGMEALGKAILDAGSKVADSIDDHTAAVHRLSGVVEKLMSDIEGR